MLHAGFRQVSSPPDGSNLYISPLNEVHTVALASRPICLMSFNCKWGLSFLNRSHAKWEVDQHGGPVFDIYAGSASVGNLTGVTPLTQEDPWWWWTIYSRGIMTLVNHNSNGLILVVHHWLKRTHDGSKSPTQEDPYWWYTTHSRGHMMLVNPRLKRTHDGGNPPTQENPWQ